jgi:hypothetical protein
MSNVEAPSSEEMEQRAQQLHSKMKVVVQTVTRQRFCELER